MVYVPIWADAIIRRTIETWEGGYSNDPSDPGGETKYGISKRSYPKENIKALTLDRAIEIYWVDWWSGQMRWLQSIKHPNVAEKIFDIGINVGGKAVARLTQQAIVACGGIVDVDGLVGWKTKHALNNISPDTFLPAFRSECLQHYQGLVRRNPDLKKYLKGWERRARA